MNMPADFLGNDYCIDEVAAAIFEKGPEGFGVFLRETRQRLGIANIDYEPFFGW